MKPCRSWRMEVEKLKDRPSAVVRCSNLRGGAAAGGAEGAVACAFGTGRGDCTASTGETWLVLAVFPRTARYTKPTEMIQFLMNITLPVYSF
jgi:hypothetical protein